MEDSSRGSDPMTSHYEELKTICENRKSVRNFAPKDVDTEDIERIKAIALTSPYASDRKNWELVVVTDKEKIQEMAETVRTKIDELNTKVREDLQDHFSQYATSFSAFESAPVLIIPTYRIAAGISTMISDCPEEVSLWERDNYVKSISCVSMLVLLAAESLGLAGCYMTGPILAENEIGEMIDIKPGRNIGAVIPIGYAAD
jgi:nitroreductase